MTWLPAPIANSMSVAVGDIEMMCVGRACSVVPSSVTGYVAASLDDVAAAAGLFESLEPHPASAIAATIAAGVCLLTVPPVGRGFRCFADGRLGPPARRPSSRAHVATAGRRPGLSLACARTSQLRDSAGVTPASLRRGQGGL